jgi:hypothetical protein
LNFSDAERDALARFLRSATGSNVAEFEFDVICAPPKAGNE